MPKLELVLMTSADKAVVRAILETHAEMQDQRTVENLELMSRLHVEEPDDADARSLVLELKSQNDSFDGDCDNLRRLAKIFM